jgi:Nif11 domain
VDELAQFIDKVGGDQELRQRVVEAEATAARTLKRDVDAITQIAADAGYDISGWSDHPAKSGLTPTDREFAASFCCTFTCCIVETSVFK